MSDLQAILNQITAVSKSDWTGDLFISPTIPELGFDGILFYGDYETDAEYDAVMSMIEDWPYTEDWETGCVNYTRPTGEQS